MCGPIIGSGTRKCSMRTSEKPAASISFHVSRSGWQPSAKNAEKGAIRCCQNARSRIFGGGDMFEKNESSAGFQDPPNFCERTSDVLNRTKHQRAYDRIHTAFCKIEMVRISLSQFPVEAGFARGAHEIRTHVRIGLDADPAHSPRVVRQIRAGSRADLDNRSRQAAKKFTLAWRNCPLVAHCAVRHQPRKYAFAEAAERIVRFRYHRAVRRTRNYGCFDRHGNWRR